MLLTSEADSPSKRRSTTKSFEVCDLFIWVLEMPERIPVLSPEPAFHLKDTILTWVRRVGRLHTQARLYRQSVRESHFYKSCNQLATIESEFFYTLHLLVLELIRETEVNAGLYVLH